MKRRATRRLPRLKTCVRRSTEKGQAMLMVIALIAVLVAIPASIEVLAVGQLPNTEQAALVVQAQQAAVAGISDYINHVKTVPGYTSYCSNSVPKWICPTGTTAAPTSTYPAFVNAASAGNAWIGGINAGITMLKASNVNASYRYVVDPSSNQTQITIYSTGQAGSPTGQHASSTEEAALTVCAANGCLYPTNGVQCIVVPSGAQSAEIVAYGAIGGPGGTGLSAGATGGGGAMVTSFQHVASTDIGHVWDLSPGQPGESGNFRLVTVAGLLPYGASGSGGFAGPSSCPSAGSNPVDLSGGNGAQLGTLVNVATATGGGGGGGSAVYDVTAGTMLAVAGGGGGGGAGDLLSFLLGQPGEGGYGALTAGNGVAGACVILCLLDPGGAGGLGGGPWTSGGVTSCATGTTSQTTCGQTGVTPAGLLQLGGLADLLNGGGGGGGGGYLPAGGGGGGGGSTGGLLTLLGNGGGGGAGASYSATTCNPVSGSNSIGSLYPPGASPIPSGHSAYPAGDTTGAGQIGITFFSGPCGGTALTTVYGTIRAASPPT
jgi:hypothetical protein